MLLRVATELVRRFYTQRMFPRMDTGDVYTFWRKESLISDDYDGLARSLLASVFSSDILTPLEEAETALVLKVKKITLGRCVAAMMGLLSGWGAWVFYRLSHCCRGGRSTVAAAVTVFGGVVHQLSVCHLRGLGAVRPQRHRRRCSAPRSLGEAIQRLRRRHTAADRRYAAAVGHRRVRVRCSRRACAPLSWGLMPIVSLLSSSPRLIEFRNFRPTDALTPVLLPESAVAVASRAAVSAASVAASTHHLSVLVEDDADREDKQ